MYVIRDRITGQTLTLTMDAHCAQASTSGFEQLDIQRDYGADAQYRHTRQPRRGQHYPSRRTPTPSPTQKATGS
jgi:hypothetical protein